VHEIVVAGATELLAAVDGVPDHDTTESGLVLVLVNQSTCLRRRQIPRASSRLGARQADEDLGILAGGVLQIRGPSIEVVVVYSSAHLVVVELDEEGVKLALVDDGLHLEIPILQGAFGSRRDEVLSGRVQVGQATQAPDHGNIAGLIL
jgi:hypothetical protein